MPTQSGIWNLKQVRDSKALARYVPGVEIAGITGVIYFGATNTLTLNGNNFGVAATVRFGYGASVSDVVVTPISNTEITVAVPSAVSNNSVGTTISVSVIAGGQISEATTTTTQFLAPTGGTITINGLYTIHTFTSSGTFASNSLATDVEYLVVAGGGASASGTASGGGGGGGFRTNVSGATSGGGAAAEAALSVTTGTNHTVTVGAGGVAANDIYVGQNGFNSVFGPITSAGGGGGAGGSGSFAGNPGGSGGGGGARTSPGAGGAGTTGQGYAGGSGYNSGSQSFTRGGGGGGAGAAGVSGSSSGNGGAGQVSSISGSATYYAGGGGCGSENFSRGLGGVGGGGNGAQYPDSTPAQNGTENTGGGGGGGYLTRANGGSGIVIVRYLTPT